MATEAPQGVAVDMRYLIDRAFAILLKKHDGKMRVTTKELDAVKSSINFQIIQDLEHAGNVYFLELIEEKH